MPELWVPESAAQERKKKARTESIDGILYSQAFESVLREYGIGTADLELARDDAGWQKLGISEQDGLADWNRANIVRRARAYYYRDPLSKQAVRIWTDYALGRGISWKAKEETTGDTLREFWDADVNEPVLSNQGQRKSSDKLLVDGELFFVFFVGPKEVKLRLIDPLEITEIITEPDDKDTKRLYKREWLDRQNKQHLAYYPDWANDDKEGEWPDLQGQDKKATEDVGVIYHVPFNTLGIRGVSLLLSGMDWSKAHRKFLEARAAITQALARFAWKAKLKGSSEQVAAERKAWESTLASGGDEESNPPPAPASTFVENEGYNLTPIKVDSGANAAQVDANMLLQIYGSAVGIFPHYFGAGEAFRLATATAMERPMRVQFEAYQQLWSDIYDNIFNFVLEQEKVPDDKRFVDIDFPPIAEKDANEKIKAIIEVVTAMPELHSDEIRKLLLTTLGVNNPDEVLSNMEPIEKASNKVVKELRHWAEALKEEQNGNGHKKGGVQAL